MLLACHAGRTTSTRFAGFETFTCCQDAGESNAGWVDKLPHMAAHAQSHKGWAYVDFPVDDGLNFLTAVAQAGSRDAFYVRMVHWAAPDAWQVSIRPMDQAMFDPTTSSDFGLRLLQVCFPISDLPELLNRVRRYGRGELVEPAPADWSTVGRRPGFVVDGLSPGIRCRYVHTTPRHPEGLPEEVFPPPSVTEPGTASMP